MPWVRLPWLLARELSGAGLSPHLGVRTMMPVAGLCSGSAQGGTLSISRIFLPCPCPSILRTAAQLWPVPSCPIPMPFWVQSCPFSWSWHPIQPRGLGCRVGSGSWLAGYCGDHLGDNWVVISFTCPQPSHKLLHLGYPAPNPG